VARNSRTSTPGCSKRGRRGRFSHLVPPALVLVFLLCSTFAIQAELVVFGTGEVLKVSAFEIQDGDVFLNLASGGRMRLPIGRIARILDDEIEEPLPPPAPIAPPPFELAFLDTHPIPTAPYGDLIHNAARRHRMNPELVRAMVRCESAFNPWATSPRGAAGLMQLMPATAERFGITSDDRWDPAHNLEAGVAYLRWLTDHFEQDLPLILAAFNSGEGAVERYGGIPPYRETRNYVRRVYGELGLETARVTTAAASTIPAAGAAAPRTAG
jgi:hypothetical protein